MSDSAFIFEDQINKILNKNELSEMAKKVIKARVFSNFMLRTAQIFEKHESKIAQLFPGEKVKIEDQNFWKELIEKVPEVKNDLSQYMENELPDLIAEAIATTQKVIK